MTNTTEQDIEYTTNVEGNLAILRAINEITFLETMRPVMTEVAKELIKAGVDFSKVGLLPPGIETLLPEQLWNQPKSLSAGKLAR